MIQHDAYEFIKTEELKDLNGKGYVFRHKKSGAHVALVENDDDNKVFYIAFRTPPQDSTGVPHIIEHSVLCGSDKYPIKDPFVELVKGSLNTFLNAMTYPDKTVYPIASTNNQDFKNLMDVYMDAVLHPNIYKNPEIFMQEGWHYEMQDADDDLTINGVVYNEMKGAFSSPDSVVSREILNSLYPDTPYGYESGGDPKVIPELSYEQFIDFHKRYYHPCNSYIYLYGDMDFEERLDYLDREYLSKYEDIHLDSTIGLQDPFEETVTKRISYPIAAEDSTEDATYLTYSFAVGDALDQELYQAFDIIEYALFDSPGAPVKEALMNKGIGKNVSGTWDPETRQPIFSVVARGANANQEQEFVDTIREVLEEQVKSGIERKSLNAGINAAQFSVREADFGSYPKGLIYGLDCLDSWLHDADAPFLHMHGAEVLNVLKNKVEDGYFEQLIEDYLLHNPHALILTVTPEPGLATENDEALKEALAVKKASFSEEEIAQIMKQTKDLKEHQGQPSTPEELATLPMLSRDDLRKDIRKYRLDEQKICETVVLHHNYFSNGIHYLNLVFRCDEISVEDYQYLSLMAQLMGLLRTDFYSYAQLSNEVNLHMGGISVALKTYSKEDRSVLLTCEVRSKFLYEEVQPSLFLIEEIVLTTDFSDKKRLKELIGMRRVGLESKLKSTGNQVISKRIGAQYSPTIRIQEEIDGISYYQFIKDLDEHFDEKADELIAALTRLQHSVFQKANLLVSSTGDETALAQVREILPDLSEKLFTDPVQKSEGQLSYPKQTEGFKDASGVQYVCCAGNFKEAGYKYTGALQILRVILNYEYFWINLRVKGGAYGCGSSFAINGDLNFSSYRDPKLLETKEIFEQTADFIENFDVDERDMTKYIIGTVSDLDVPKTVSQKGLAALTYYLREETDERRQQMRDEVIGAKPEDIRALAPLVRDTMAQGYFGAVGNEDVLEANADDFDVLYSLT